MGLLQLLRDTFGPDAEDGIRYRCTNCGREFVYRVAFEQPDCPYCDSTAVESLDET